MDTLKFAVALTKQTNALLAKKFRPFGLGAARLKKNEEIVTEADIVANDFITKKLLKSFPSDDIVSEEAEKIDNPGKAVWYIDPLDGTTNFSYGFPNFATCLARVKDGQIEIGVIGIPLSKELFWAKRGGAAFMNGKKISVSKITSNHGTRHLVLLCEGHTVESQAAFLRAVKRIDLKTTRFRVFSSAGVELAAIASGRADGYITAGIRPWDVLPGVLLVRAAGGKVTNFSGREWTIKDTEIIASNGLIHEKLLKLVK